MSEYETAPVDVLEDYLERMAIITEAEGVEPSRDIPTRVRRYAWRLMRQRYGDALCASARLLGWRGYA